MSNDSKFITFVLGAGASFEVGMPTGKILKKNIGSSLSFESDNFGSLSGGDDQLRQAVINLSQLQKKKNELPDYLKAAKQIKGGMQQAPSIDNFIDSHRSNTRVSEVGKLAIASEILKAERKSKLYVSHSNSYNKLNFEDIEDTWFNEFFKLLTLNVEEQDLPARLKHVRVVTFNYDRTLEHYLFHSIQNYYGCSPEKSAKILSYLNVLHPYGKVGDLPWQKTKNGVPFGAESQTQTLIQVFKLLRTFTEETTSGNESQIKSIRAAIFEAEILAFLGFAYHKQNLELLFDTAKVSPSRFSNQVYGTAFGISESDRKVITSEIAKYGNYISSLVILREDLSAAQLIPEYSRSLLIPSAT
jgi:hypothetical protein